MKKDGFYSTGSFAALAHVSVRTIRYYDNMNLLKPSYVTESGARFYTDYDLVKLQQILLFKYLGFSLDDIKQMPSEHGNNSMLKNALTLQKKLVAERMEEMKQVETAIDSTIQTLEENREPDWSRMLELIHLTSMENTLKKQYANASNISARIRLHDEFSKNRQGWFPWIFENCRIKSGMKILELGCGNGALWLDNCEKLDKLQRMKIVLSDISAGILHDASGNMAEKAAEMNSRRFAKFFEYRNFDCAGIPYEDASFDLVIANHLLFYCEDIDKVCREVRRVLKPGGRFVCSTYSVRHMKEISSLVSEFDDRIVLSGEKLYDIFGLDNGAEILQNSFERIEKAVYDDEIILNDAGPLIEYILSCHGNQNRYLLERYSDFRSFVTKKVGRKFRITKDAGIFICE